MRFWVTSLQLWRRDIKQVKDRKDLQKNESKERIEIKRAGVKMESQYGKRELCLDTRSQTTLV